MHDLRAGHELEQFNNKSLARRRRNGLNPPALSKSLRQLELAMNAMLFERVPKGVELTSERAAILARVSKLRLSLNDVTREISGFREGRAGHQHIGMAAVLAHMVPRVCTPLLK